MSDFDYSFIEEVGSKIKEIIFNDGSETDWADEAYEEHERTGTYPFSCFKNITNRLKDADDELLTNFSLIYNSSEENMDSIIGTILDVSYPDNEEGNDGEANDTYNSCENYNHSNAQSSSNDNESFSIQSQSLIDQSQGQVNINPNVKFARDVKSIASTFNISEHIAYLVLKNSNWRVEKANDALILHREDLISSLKINTKNLREPLSMKSIGVSECGCCFCDDEEIFELYCGHQLCSNCWKSEMIEQIDRRQPAQCRQDECGCEIMSSDILKFLGKEVQETYDVIVLEDQILKSDTIIHCPGIQCDRFLSINDVEACNVAHCKECNSRICWKCNNEAHAPLVDCDKINEWKEKVSDEMFSLQRNQEKWFQREKDLKSYRESHIQEVKEVNRQILAMLKIQHDKADQNELEEIQKLEESLNDSDNSNSSMSSRNSLEIKRHQHKMKQQERMTEMNNVEEENSFLVAAIQSPKRYDYFMTKYRESQNIRAFSKVAVSDDEFIQQITKKCPKCKSPIQRNDGCNQMSCPICQFQFCWVCSENWQTHNDHFVCNKYKSDKKNDCKNDDFYKDDDFTYYPPPMNAEKRAGYLRWNKLYSEFMNHFMAIEKLKENENAKKNELMELFLNWRIEEKAEKFVNNFLSTLKFSETVLMWSGPAIYFMNPDLKKTKLFENYVGLLEMVNGKMIEFWETPNDKKEDEFDNALQLNEKMINNVLAAADPYSM